ncbi:NAD(P)/FAD-dependent oxidoreductase [Candidatus Formimonas warabiya]|uniref:Pyridine nucleotide-disulfide oxidoreductase n=1 Tax=Formimonas warabiya TaxID=1761012 RepID=A0A3G1L078_FORW1|nr:NAD(P)/FAD-dependent oxidoreductase [Candidatus Formimonas warabiya]ATW27885.1 pyridine nucleotide-disulfide oxidoreductase [Candidatus Formimonas warabiya]
MKTTEIAIVGGGPGGMCAALVAANQGAKVTLFDSAKILGGQLIKQTHRFFGSEKEHAGTRGIQICAMLEGEIRKNENIDLHLDATVVAAYENKVIAYEEGDKYEKMACKKIIVAAGASEKMLAFMNNDLPGVYGAGAVQTLMNVHGVIPGQKVLMIGSGNIGLIVSYQLMQAGVKVEAIIEGAPAIGGYKVHASKVRRMGVPILTSHTILEAYGTECVEGAIICRLDEKWDPVPGTEKRIDVDVICLSVGLSPLTELLWQVGCKMKYIPSLGGYVPARDENLETTVSGFYVAGDASGVEEASAAMIEGKIAGLAAAASLGYDRHYGTLRKEYLDDIWVLRSGPVGEKIRQGLQILAE